MASEPFELLRDDELSVVRALVNKTVITDYGIITKDHEDGYVEVLSVQRKYGAVTRFDCKYLNHSSALLSVSEKPTVGDLVMILCLPSRKETFFTAESPVEVQDPAGYSYRTAVCMPIGIFKDTATTRVTMTEEDTTVDSDLPLNVNAEAINLNGDSKSLVTHAELNSALQSFKTSISNYIGAHTHPVQVAPATGTGATTGIVVSPTPISVDISAAKTQTIKTGG